MLHLYIVKNEYLQNLYIYMHRILSIMFHKVNIFMIFKNSKTQTLYTFGSCFIFEKFITISF